MTIKPLDDRILVKRVDLAEKKVGSIIIPDTAREKPQVGKVLALGTDEDLAELIANGDRVLFAKYGGSEFEFDNQEFILLQRSEILAVLEE